MHVSLKLKNDRLIPNIIICANFHLIIKLFAINIKPTAVGKYIN